MTRKAILILAVIIIAGITVFTKPLAMAIVKANLQNSFPGSQVSINDIYFKPFSFIVFSGIEIKNQPVYRFSADEFRINFNFSKLYMKNAVLEIDTPDDRLQNFKKYINLKKSGGGFAVKNFEISGLKIKVDSSDIDFDAQVSAPGNLSIGKFQYDKLIVTDLKSKVQAADGSISLTDLTAGLWGGSILGSLDINTGRDLSYNTNLKAAGLDLREFINAFKLNDKVQAQGKIEGEIRISAKGFVFDEFSGNFSVISPGGILTITDNKFLETMADETKQPLELIEQSFKEYHFSTGTISAGKQDNDLGLSVFMDGEKGKRDIQIIFHNFR